MSATIVNVTVAVLIPANVPTVGVRRLTKTAVERALASVGLDVVNVHVASHLDEPGFDDKKTADVGPTR